MTSKEKLVSAATELFYARGYLATSVEDLLEAARVSKSNFYYHFPSKDALGLAVLDHRVDVLRSGLCKTLHNDELSPKDRMRTFLFGLVSYQEEIARGGCPFGNLVAEMSHHNEEIRQRLSAFFTGLTESVTQVIDLGRSDGSFRGDLDPRATGALVVQWIQGMCLMVKCHQCTEQARASVAQLYRLLLPSQTAE